MRAGDWIKCKDRLPDTGAEVLAWVPNRIQDCTPGPRILVWDGRTWVEDDAVEYEPEDVTHWAPITEPPED